MALRCLVVRGLVKEVEEEINKFLGTHEVVVLHMAQSEHGEYLSITMIYDEVAPIG
jgi:RNA-binding protein YhbY